jgi:hypothetical protein
MDAVRFQHRHLDVACELDEATVGGRVDEWRTLQKRALGAEAIAGGARLWLPADAWAPAEDLARRESACCGFLDIELAADGDRLRLDVTSDAASAQPMIASLLGIETGGAPS